MLQLFCYRLSLYLSLESIFLVDWPAIWQLSLGELYDFSRGRQEKSQLIEWLHSALPAPVHTPAPDYDDFAPILPSASASQIPSYGSRKGWKPKSGADFNGGGAYPEVCRYLYMSQESRH